VQAVSDVSFTSRAARRSVFGESGSGKSVSNLAIQGSSIRARRHSGLVEFMGVTVDVPPKSTEDPRQDIGNDLQTVRLPAFRCTASATRL